MLVEPSDVADRRALFGRSKKNSLYLGRFLNRNGFMSRLTYLMILIISALILKTEVVFVLVLGSILAIPKTLPRNS